MCTCPLIDSSKIWTFSPVNRTASSKFMKVSDGKILGFSRTLILELYTTDTESAARTQAGFLLTSRTFFLF